VFEGLRRLATASLLRRQNVAETSPDHSCIRCAPHSVCAAQFLRQPATPVVGQELPLCTPDASTADCVRRYVPVATVVLPDHSPGQLSCDRHYPVTLLYTLLRRFVELISAIIQASVCCTCVVLSDTHLHAACLMSVYKSAGQAQCASSCLVCWRNTWPEP
jgi:hypothetical protein